MEMTKNMLLHLLGAYDRINAQSDFSFSQLLILQENDFEDQTLYLTTDLTAPDQKNILYLSSFVDVNHAFRIHQQFQNWREQCVHYAYVEHDLNTILDISSQLLNWDLSIISPSYRVDAGSGNFYVDYNTYPSQMPQSEVEFLYLENPSFDQTFKLHGIQFYPQIKLEQAVLYYYNMFQETLYLGRLLLTIPKDHNNCGALALMELLCRDVENCYRYLYLHRRQEEQHYRFYDLWKTLLKNQPLDTEFSKIVLNHMGWNASDPYQILYLSPVGYYYDCQTLKVYAVELENRFPGCVAAELDGGIYCLRNLRVHSSDRFRQDLSTFLRDHLFRAGVSNVFNDFFDSYRYRIQAEDAMKLGQKKTPHMWRYEFCDYVSEYVHEQCLTQYPAQDLCPRNLRLLMEYDRKHPETELLETLFQYYTCQFNAQLAAQKLFIHRTTFFYRMNKIQKIASFHPEDAKETLQILLAFQLMKKIE